MRNVAVVAVLALVGSLAAAPALGNQATGSDGGQYGASQGGICGEGGPPECAPAPQAGDPAGPGPMNDPAPDPEQERNRHRIQASVAGEAPRPQAGGPNGAGPMNEPAPERKQQGERHRSTECVAAGPGCGAGQGDEPLQSKEQARRQLQERLGDGTCANAGAAWMVMQKLRHQLRLQGPIMV